MVRDELSGAVMIFLQTKSTGTTAPPPCALPYSDRHSRKLIVSQNTALRIKARREII